MYTHISLSLYIYIYMYMCIIMIYYMKPLGPVDLRAAQVLPRRLRGEDEVPIIYIYIYI